MKVTIELDEEQACVVMEALEFYSRIQLGQIEEVSRIVQLSQSFEKFRETDQRLLDHATLALKRILFPELEWNSYHGIYSNKIRKWVKTAWDVYQTMRHGISWAKNPEGGITVNFDPPMQTNESTPLPKITVEMEHE